jgi:hypothetical protein
MSAAPTSAMASHELVRAKGVTRWGGRGGGGGGGGGGGNGESGRQLIQRLKSGSSANLVPDAIRRRRITST